jgi:hypothetical protein
MDGRILGYRGWGKGKREGVLEKYKVSFIKEI